MVQSQGGKVSDHIPDVTKMISDTPRMQSALLDHPDAGFAKIWQVGCDIERELNTANAEIERLTNKVAQLYEGAEEAKQRIKRLDETLEAVTDKIDNAWGIYMKFKEAKP
jgi:predicted  nucleic acid-binding Zn-ribbon protein